MHDMCVSYLLLPAEEEEEDLDVVGGASVELAGALLLDPVKSPVVVSFPAAGELSWLPNS